MQFQAHARIVHYVLLFLFILVVAFPMQLHGQVCGDVTGEGTVTTSDITNLTAYLFYGGPVPNSFHDANADNHGDITNNDVAAIASLVFHSGSVMCTDISPNPGFVPSSDTVEFRELIVPPGNTSWDVEVWIKATAVYYGLSLPFAFDCSSSPLTLQNVTFLVSNGASQVSTGSGVMGMFHPMSAFSAGEYQLATLSFSINSSLSDQRITIDTLLDYPPSNTLVLSRIDFGFWATGYWPAVVEVLPDPPPFTEVEGDSADVVSIVTADLDLDTYTDVVYAGDTEVGLFVSWGQDTDPPIGTPVKLEDLTDATVDIYHIDGDTLPDIVAVTTETIYTLINNGDRTFTTSAVANTTSAFRQPGRTSASIGTAPQFAIGFVDDDQHPDLVVSPDRWFEGDGTGGFSNNPAFGFTFASVAIGDFDRDGYDDLAVLESDSIVIYTNDDISPGTFARSGAHHVGLASYDLSSITTNIDVNLDGVADVVSAVAENTGVDDESVVIVALGDGVGNLTPADTITITGTAPQVSLSDVDRDYYQDIVVSNASDGNLEIYYNDGATQFGNVVIVDIAVSDDLMFALTTADLDRDGQPDFISGSAAGDNLTLSLHNDPDEPVLDDELFVTGYDYIHVQVTNPNGYVVSPSLQTVAGSDYYHLHVDDNDLLDVRAYDYNLQYGLYIIEATLRPGTGGSEPLRVGIGIDGSQQNAVARNYSPPFSFMSSEPLQNADFVFPFAIEETSSIFPVNGLPTTNVRPTFDWPGLVEGDPPGDEYRFQMNRYHDFSDVAMYDAGGLSSAEFTPGAPLDIDSIYYWRVLKSSDGGATYYDTSFAFAAYIIDGCCGIWTRGVTGNANCSDDGKLTLSDITKLIDRVYISKEALCCEANGNTNGDVECKITLSDITILIDAVFISKTDPEDCRLECEQ